MLTPPAVMLTLPTVMLTLPTVMLTQVSIRNKPSNPALPFVRVTLEQKSLRHYCRGLGILRRTMNGVYL